MPTLEEVTKKLLAFRAERDWEKFHNPKDMAISLALEAAEVLEHFQWKNCEEVKQYAESNKQALGEELADVFNWVLLLSYDLKIDLLKASADKIKKNQEKYPVEKAKGQATKYIDL